MFLLLSLARNPKSLRSKKTDKDHPQPPDRVMHEKHMKVRDVFFFFWGGGGGGGGGGES